MRGVQLDRAEAGSISALRGGRESPLDTHNSLNAELFRRRVALAKRDCARRDCPPTSFGLWNAALPRPGAVNARLAPSVRELDARDRALRFDKLDDWLERLKMFLAPNTKILRGNTPFR